MSCRSRAFTSAPARRATRPIAVNPDLRSTSVTMQAPDWLLPSTVSPSHAEFELMLELCGDPDSVVMDLHGAALERVQGG